ncbi:MAG TPA: hypothetical protein VKR56_10975 [Candidatus Cybelea sp.]|nr:hypothetical protein [Candidatus Cybelea sp.]
MKPSTPNRPKSTRGNRGVAETSANFSFGSGRSYADAAEYASKGLAFDVLAIARETGRGYHGRDRWALTVKAADRETEILTLGCNPGRDEELAKAQAHLERGGGISNKRLRLSGGAYYLADAD